MANTITNWLPIAAAPTNKSVIVTNAACWTMARLVACEVQVLRFGWPLVEYKKEWRWVFSNSTYRRINFAPTHYALLDLDEPPSWGASG
jgi:hypothetical protein